MAALCREQTARDALEEAQRRYNEAKAMTLPPSSDPSYGFLEQGKRVAMKKAARQISDAQERIRAARQEAEQLLEQKCLQYEQNFHSQDQIQDRTLEFRQEDSVIYCDVRYVISGEIGTIREIFIK